MAFVSLREKIMNVEVWGTFCVLRIYDDDSSFLMTGINKEKIALYFINALEKM